LPFWSLSNDRRQKPPPGICGSIAGARGLVARTGFRQIRRCNGNGQREGKEGRADLPESRVAAVLCCLYLFAEEAPMSVSLAEHKGWRCCQKCTGLFFAGDPPSDRGHCPVGDQHRQFGQTAYIMQYDPGGLEYSDAEGMAGIQIGWRRCQKCEGLFLAGWLNRSPQGSVPPIEIDVIDMGM